MERSATEKGKDNNKRSDRIQRLFRYGAHGIEIWFLLPYHRNCSHQVTNGPITKSNGLFSPCLTFCSMTLLTTLFSKNSLLLASESIAYNLSGRSSFTGSYSSFCPLNAGVIQDSIFGHLLFSLCILSARQANQFISSHLPFGYW